MLPSPPFPFHQARRAATPARAANRDLWLPGTKAPAHLDGSLPGDRGFDPLGLGANGPDRLKWYAEGERTNARWAMIAVAGCLGQELLGKGKWFEAGAQQYAIPTLGLLAIQQVLFGYLELNRYAAFKTGQKNALFPFDPAGMNSETNAVKEIKNGRLAMVAFIGFAVQALVTREGPIEGLFAHLANPFGHNIVTNIANLPNVIGK